MIDRYESVLYKLAKNLNQAKIKWSLGGSLLLYYLGYDMIPHDIDLLVDELQKDILEETIQEYNYILEGKNPNYSTSYFYSLTIDSIDVDIMLGFKVNTDHGIYVYPFDNQYIKTIYLKDEPIYLSDLSEWVKVYKKMNRLYTVNLIEKGKSNL